ncbi:MAG: endonuclease domain-containing protein [Thermodesulfobacteriota bacterium]
MLNYNKTLKEYSRRLRKEMTDAERKLWSKIRGKQLKGYQFYRQKPIGNFIVDFYCPKANLVLELDGGQHYTEEGKAKDMRRGEFMRSIGLRVLRFSDKEVFENMDGVIEKIEENL